MAEPYSVQCYGINNNHSSINTSEENTHKYVWEGGGEGATINDAPPYELVDVLIEYFMKYDWQVALTCRYALFVRYLDRINSSICRLRCETFAAGGN